MTKHTEVWRCNHCNSTSLTKFSICGVCETEQIPQKIIISNELKTGRGIVSRKLYIMSLILSDIFESWYWTYDEVNTYNETQKDLAETLRIVYSDLVIDGDRKMREISLHEMKSIVDWEIISEIVWKLYNEKV